MAAERTVGHPVSEVVDLRERYPQPVERALKKSLPTIDQHMRRFIALSPFVCLGTSSDAGADVTPRGDRPGFVRVVDDRTLLVPDWPGNNRLDSLTNVIANPRVGLLFFVPGVDETLRVNGEAAISMDPAWLQLWDVGGKQPRSVLRIAVHEAYLHCGKALIRSKLWSNDYKVDRQALPSYGQMLKDQISTPQTADEIQASVAGAYKNGLY